MSVVRLEQAALVVDDLAAAEEFFVALGLEVDGATTVEGPVVDAITGLTGVRSRIVVLRPPGGGTAVELIRYENPTSPGAPAVTPSHAYGIRHLMFRVTDLRATVARLGALGHGLVGEVGDWEGQFLLAYVHGPAGTMVELAEQTG